MLTYPIKAHSNHPFNRFAMFSTPYSPKRHKRSRWWLLLLLGAVVTLPGCTPRYLAVPECEITSPPDADRYLQAVPDERLIMMSSAYIAQVKQTASCNKKIRLVNAANKARDTLD